MSKTSIIPYRQIRASYSSSPPSDSYVIVYQAYSRSIALPALSSFPPSFLASPGFKTTRMTWIKPSWCWMMYRSGYGTKDSGQEVILEIKMRSDGFLELLKRSELSHGKKEQRDDAEETVRIQWDPERSPSLEKLSYRSIQIGISPSLIKRWCEEWILDIKDVTERAKSLKIFLEEAKLEGRNFTIDELEQKELMPIEREWIVEDAEIRRKLKIDNDGTMQERESDVITSEI